MKTPIPTVEDVRRIDENSDPVIRNLQITQCYHELTAILAGCMGAEANWCTFATWASKQAGQTIRKEDLERLLERSLDQSASAVQASRNVAVVMNRQAGQQIMGPQAAVQGLIRYTSAVDRASDAVG